MENKNKRMEKERTKSMSGRKRPLVSADIIKAKKVDVMQLFFPSVRIHGGCQYQLKRPPYPSKEVVQCPRKARGLMRCMLDQLQRIVCPKIKTRVVKLTLGIYVQSMQSSFAEGIADGM